MNESLLPAQRLAIARNPHKIVERRSGVAAIAPGLTTSGRKILHLIDLLSKGTVTPTSLADIVEDWL